MLFLSLSISVSGGYLRFIVIVFLLIISSLYGQMSKRFTSRVKELQKIIIIEVHMRDARPAPQKGGYVPLLKITKTCGVQRGKVDPNPWKIGRQLRGRIQFCPKSVDFLGGYYKWAKSKSGLGPPLGLCGGPIQGI